MKVFTDFHHAGLLNSLIMLFEGRLGGEVYRPIGLEWANKGFWQVFDHPATRQQYLSLKQGYKPTDGSQPLNNITKIENNVYYCQDIDSGYYNKAITLETFRDIGVDIVIASLPQHLEPFRRLIAEYAPQAKLIYQVGNQWNGFYSDNIMASARLSDIPDNINYIEYHQEFDLKKFHPIARGYYNHTITSLLNLPENTPDYPLLLELEQRMPKWKFKIYGGMGRDGAKHGIKQVARSIRESQFIWQVKKYGDGYGHILFNSYACGKPIITRLSDYQGKLGEDLLEDGITCIAIDNLSVDKIIDKLNYYGKNENYNIMSANAYKRFKEVVDFDKEEIKLKEFIQRLK